MSNESITRRIKSYELDTNREQKYGIKSAIIWGYPKESPNSIFPMLYLSKPKNISQEDYEHLLTKIDITIRR